MEEKERIIRLIETADICKDFWSYDILARIQNNYAKGYLSARHSELNTSLSPSQEEFREEILSCCEHDIWNEH